MDDERIEEKLEETPPESPEHERVEESALLNTDRRVDALEKRMTDIEAAIEALSVADLAILIEAVKELQKEDIAPQSSSKLYRPLFRKRE